MTYKIKFIDMPETEDRVMYEYFVAINEALKTVQSALNDIDQRLQKLKV